MPVDNCVVCDRPLQQSLQPWHFFCSWCGYEKSSLEPTINQHAAHQHIDETARETGLRALRLSNFRTLLTAVEKLKPQGGRLLEVGSAHGVFAEASIEPLRVVHENFLHRENGPGIESHYLCAGRGFAAAAESIAQ